jgi:hypothetical protein
MIMAREAGRAKRAGSVRAISEIEPRSGDHRTFEVERVGQQMAREGGLTYLPTTPSDYISGRLTGVANLVSGRFAMIDDGLGFQLVPWHAVLDERRGQYISGLQRDDGGSSGHFEETGGSACNDATAQSRGWIKIVKAMQSVKQFSGAAVEELSASRHTKCPRTPAAVPSNGRSPDFH